MANNPTRWTDPSGHEVDPRHLYITVLIMARPAFMLATETLCAAVASAVAVGSAPLAVTPGGTSYAIGAAGNTFALCLALVYGAVTGDIVTMHPERVR